MDELKGAHGAFLARDKGNQKGVDYLAEALRNQAMCQKDFFASHWSSGPQLEASLAGEGLPFHSHHALHDNGFNPNAGNLPSTWS